jgi:hypothetical protein
VLFARRFSSPAIFGVTAVFAACSSDFPPFPEDRGAPDAAGERAESRDAADSGDVSSDGPPAPRDSSVVDGADTADAADAAETASGDAQGTDAPPEPDAPTDGASPADRVTSDVHDAANLDTTVPLACDGGPTVMACGSSCVNVASSAQNCRACGHDCGDGSSCQAGVCQPVILYTDTALPDFEVDGTGIYFRVTTGVSTCPLTGCTLSPTPVATGGTPLLLANGYVTISAPLIPVGEDYSACPETGCTSTNHVALISQNRAVSVSGIIASPSGFFYAFNGPPGNVLAKCMMPSAAGCGSTGAIANVQTTLLVASDTFVYFTATLGDASFAQLYSCPTSATNCAPTPMNTGYKQVVAYLNDLYILFPVGGPMQTIAKCPGTGCGGGGATPVVTTTYGIDEIAVDASGVYWTQGTGIKACPLTGCVGGPTDVAVNQGTPQELRLSGGFVYWANGTDNTIRRVAKPVF